MSWAVEYLRPYGWCEAGRGFATEAEAKAAACAQLPGNVEFRTVQTGALDSAIEAELRAAVSVSGESPKVAPAAAPRAVTDARKRLVSARDSGLLFSAEVATFEALVEVAEAARGVMLSDQGRVSRAHSRLEEALQRLSFDA